MTINSPGIPAFPEHIERREDVVFNQRDPRFRARGTALSGDFHLYEKLHLDCLSLISSIAPRTGRGGSSTSPNSESRARPSVKMCIMLLFLVGLARSASEAGDRQVTAVAGISCIGPAAPFGDTALGFPSRFGSDDSLDQIRWNPIIDLLRCDRGLTGEFVDRRVAPTQ